MEITPTSDCTRLVKGPAQLGEGRIGEPQEDRRTNALSDIPPASNMSLNAGSRCPSTAVWPLNRCLSFLTSFTAAMMMFPSPTRSWYHTPLGRTTVSVVSAGNHILVHALCSKALRISSNIGDSSFSRQMSLMTNGYVARALCSPCFY